MITRDHTYVTLSLFPEAYTVTQLWYKSLLNQNGFVAT